MTSRANLPLAITVNSCKTQYMNQEGAPLIAENSDVTLSALERFSSKPELQHKIYQLAVDQLGDAPLRPDALEGFPTQLDAEAVAAVSVVAQAMVSRKVTDRRVRESHARELQEACVTRLGRLSLLTGDLVTAKSAAEFLVARGSRRARRYGGKLFAAASRQSK